ncbi:MAG TPA: hypothetical protein PLM56_15130 [Cyclobacteriaceae bacterium]|nr:hypothetical protein [Cyclobacteriaceae bacterium]HRF34837.1 hypothetical protein [Cyclobacteriaceae bacterium]
MKTLFKLVTAIKTVVFLNNIPAGITLVILALSFAACESDGSPSGNDIDPKLIASWQSSAGEIYVFHTDGRFYHFTTLSRVEGTFTASDGKIYFRNIVYEKGETWEILYPDAIYEYQVGKDDHGDYLNIANFLYGVTYVDMSSAYKFRK